MLQRRLKVGRIIPQHHTGDQRFLPAILIVHLCHRHIELAMQTVQQWLQAGAFFLQGSTTRQKEINGEYTNHERQ